MTNQPYPLIANRYRISKLLGRGGFGQVWLAEDTHLAGRLLAIKENLDLTPEARTQFQQEASILASLRHPNLPTVIELIDDGNPQHSQYLLMEYVEGDNLEEMVPRRGGKLAEADALRWIMQVLDAVEYLHSRTPPIIHRDIKPANIKVTPQGTAVLVDFGIAKQHVRGHATMNAARSASPGYAPPEQWYGTGTDTRTDIYALGGTLYYLLTGVLPTEAPMRQAGNTMPSVRLLNNKVSRRTAEVIDRAMALEANNRYANAGQMRDALSGKQITPQATVREQTPAPTLRQTPASTPTPAVLPQAIPVSSQPAYQPPPATVPMQQPPGQGGTLRLDRAGAATSATGTNRGTTKWIAGVFVLLVAVGLIAIAIATALIVPILTPAAQATATGSVAEVIPTAPVAPTTASPAVADTAANTIATAAPAQKPTRTPVPARIADTPTIEPSPTVPQPTLTATPRPNYINSRGTLRFGSAGANIVEFKPIPDPISNLAVSAEFINPPNAPWDYGFIFRQQQLGTYAAVILGSDGSCYVWVTANGSDVSKTDCNIGILNTMAGSTNKLALKIKNTQLEARLNDGATKTFDLQQLGQATVPGTVSIVTEFFSRSKGVNTGSLQYANFMVWKLD